MVTAASTANLAIILIDARRGVLAQTKRHSYIAHLMGIPHILVAVNKMDLVNFDQAVFEQIKADYLAFAAKLGIEDVMFLPLSALTGDNVVDRSAAMPWYQGPTLIETLEAAPAAHSEHSEAFRLPVQYVCRPQDSANPELHDYRGFMGRIEAGQIAIGDAVSVLPSGRTTTVKDVQLGGQSIGSAFVEQSVTLLLSDEIDISRGDMIVKSADTPPLVTKAIEAELCWLSETPLEPSRRYLVRHTTRTTQAKLAGISYKLDIHSLEEVAAERLQMNDIARVTLKLAQPLVIDAYAVNRGTGAFIVIDESTNNTVGAGMIVAAA